jgi:hypothetical protein
VLDDEEMAANLGRVPDYGWMYPSARRTIFPDSADAPEAQTVGLLDHTANRQRDRRGTILGRDRTTQRLLEAGPPRHREDCVHVFDPNGRVQVQRRF